MFRDPTSKVLLNKGPESKLMKYIVKWKCEETGFQTFNTITLEDIDNFCSSIIALSRNDKPTLEELNEVRQRCLSDKLDFTIMNCLVTQLNNAEDCFNDVPWERERDPVILSIKAA
jgi:hypothetical protein